jgi:hypothetical protein
MYFPITKTEQEHIGHHKWYFRLPVLYKYRRVPITFMVTAYSLVQNSTLAQCLRKMAEDNESSTRVQVPVVAQVYTHIHLRVL